jgi:predicted ferric reductase
MKTIQTTALALLIGLSVLWWQADGTALMAASGVFPWRTLMTQYTGVLTFAAMSLAVILASRPVWLESFFGGLDKMYRLHKWLGISVLVLGISHWLWVKAPKWLVEAGWLIRPPRGKRPDQSVEIFSFFQNNRDLAEQIGEWAAYLVLALIAIALIKRFPYRYFSQSHRLLALVYLALVVHAAMLMSFHYWSLPIGIVMAIFMLAGTACALKSLLQRIGNSRKAVAMISQLDYYGGVGVNAISLQLKSRWPKHEAGQFAFVTFDASEGAHPFTLSSAWKGDGQILLLIKALGDYTQTLASKLKTGDLVTIEGPYGRFNFSGSAQRQIWIAGGIGITPFIARMQALALKPDGRVIDLFHSSKEEDAAALSLLTADAAVAGVNLHLFIDARDGHLTAEYLRNTVTDWLRADVWFCGPTAFADAIRDDLLQHGLRPAQFHQELFAMR